MLPQQSSRLQAQLCGEGEVRAWQISTSLPPSPRTLQCHHPGSEPGRSKEQRKGIPHLTWLLCARPVEALTLCPHSALRKTQKWQHRLGWRGQGLFHMAGRELRELATSFQSLAHLTQRSLCFQTVGTGRWKERGLAPAYPAECEAGTTGTLYSSGSEANIPGLLISLVTPGHFLPAESNFLLTLSLSLSPAPTQRSS